jgi:hypothetical protein
MELHHITSTVLQFARAANEVGQAFLPAIRRTDLEVCRYLEAKL